MIFRRTGSRGEGELHEAPPNTWLQYSSVERIWALYNRRWAGVRKPLVRNIKPTLRAAQEGCLDMKESQHNGELTDKPRKETESVDLRIEKSKNRFGEKEWRFKYLESREFLEAPNIAWFGIPMKRFAQDRHNGHDGCWCLQGGERGMKEKNDGWRPRKKNGLGRRWLTEAHQWIQESKWKIVLNLEARQHLQGKTGTGSHHIRRRRLAWCPQYKKRE